MAPSTAHLDRLKDLFSPFGDITVRKMFGGAGVFCDGMIFAIADDDDIWLKVDDVTREVFEAEGLQPFTIEMNGKTGSMSYYRPPDDIYDDEDTHRYWTLLAIGAARRNVKPARKKKSRPGGKTRPAKKA